MSEETVVSNDTGASVGTGEVDQSSYVADALDSYQNSHKEQTSPEPKAKTPKVDEKAVQKSTEETPKAEEKIEKPPVKDGPQLDPLDSAFKGENGDFDLNAFAEFSVPDTFQAAPEVAEVAKTLEAAPDNRPAWEKEREEVKTYEQNLQQEVLNPLQKVADLINGGMDPMQALNQIYLERQADLQKHISEFKEKREFERQSKIEERIAERERLAHYAERSKTNCNELAAALPGASPAEKNALFNHILFSKDIGAQILNHLFVEKFPDAEKLPEAEKRQKADAFLKEITADKNKLRFVFERALDRATRLKMTKALERARLQQSAKEKETRLAAQKNPAGPYTRKQPKASADPWEAYSNSHLAMADRV